METSSFQHCLQLKRPTLFDKLASFSRCPCQSHFTISRLANVPKTRGCNGTATSAAVCHVRSCGIGERRRDQSFGVFGKSWHVDGQLLGGGFQHFLFSSLPGEMIQFNIFQMGWNQQPDFVWMLSCQKTLPKKMVWNNPFPIFCCLSMQSPFHSSNLLKGQWDSGWLFTTGCPKSQGSWKVSWTKTWGGLKNLKETSKWLYKCTWKV